MPDKIGRVRLRQSITLEPLREHLVWGKLSASAPLSAGSTVIVEPTQSRSRPRNVLVGRVVTPPWGDRWVPLKLINPSSKALTLKRNCKIADVFQCVAVEELPFPEKVSVNIQDVTQGSVSTKSPEQRKEVLNNLGLQDLDLDGCEVSDQWKDRLLQLVVKYESSQGTRWTAGRLRTSSTKYPSWTRGRFACLTAECLQHSTSS